MKKIVSLILALALCFTAIASLTSCGAASDWEKIEEDGYFVCGITVYAPMNYFTDEGDLVGFDTEFAEAVADYLGVEVKFTVIKWPSKYLELNSGAIDVIWNGFTFGMEAVEGGEPISRTEYVDFTYAYLENKQVIVTKTSRLEELSEAADFAGLEGAAEGGSSGEGVAKELAGESGTVTTFDNQAAALTEVASGTLDFAVIDYQMAASMVGQGSFADLSINDAYAPESEVYAIGCRKGSDFTTKLNAAIEALSENGKLAEIAAKYNLQNDLIANIGKEQ